ncbi:nitroreductase/quinone reductase family protein [Nocardia gipuzkoensis]|uniref:nitroreductase/quinone reductase family protein n=1 Tax=Nocardia gipuzkoensis TaxID=2749991 RepID=UPI003EDEDB89
MLETTGRHSTQPRRIPLARGPMDGTVMSLISVHGTHADRVRNVQVDPRVRCGSGGGGTQRQPPSSLLPNFTGSTSMAGSDRSCSRWTASLRSWCASTWQPPD